MGRIRGEAVAARFPEAGPVDLVIFGEAPGPRGADQSGVPFWGDGAGLPVYRALAAAGRARVPEAAWTDWDGARFRALGLQPVLVRTALSNAYPACPTRDGEHFHAPTDRDLRAPGNQDRLRAELRRAAGACPGRLRVVAFGKRAAWILERLEDAPPFDLAALPHPSAQGLLQAAPGKGKGCRLADLRAAWERHLADLLGNLNIS